MSLQGMASVMDLVSACAEAAHEATRICRVLDDHFSTKPWKELTNDNQRGLKTFVLLVLQHGTAEKAHNILRKDSKTLPVWSECQSRYTSEQTMVAEIVWAVAKMRGIDREQTVKDSARIRGDIE